MRCSFALPIVLTTLPLFACRGTTTDGLTAQDDAGDNGSTTGDGGTLIVLQAFGGDSGEVAAQVPLLTPGVGLQETCAAPLDAGACQLNSCQHGGVGSAPYGSGDVGPDGPMSASVGSTTITIPYNGDGYGTAYFPSSVTLGAGGIMTFRGGNGGDVPKFDVSATIPGLAVITSPAAAPDGGAATLDTSQDLSVAWLPISIGQIHFGIYGGSLLTHGPLASITCTFEGGAGSGVIFQTLLSSLKMSGATPVYATWNSELDATTLVGGLTVITQSFQNSPPATHEFNVTLQ
ncbi:MAG: hypothetical protein ABSC94_32660 [Polyangiaceae bacterium]